MNKTELLAPAGSFEKLKYAFAYGADAVYAGVPRFSLRARENDFTDETIREAVDYTHKIGKKIYLTLNIFPHNRKLDAFKKTLVWLKDIKPDAIILSDPGIIHYALEICPEIPIHLSTQANTVNWASVKFWKQAGVKRIILSRELSIEEITEIRQRVPDIELEAFIHGAICVAYSGRCLLSNYFNHRDPNQGTCTNSCRWEYKIFKNSDTVEEYKLLKDKYYLEEADRPGNLLPIDEDEHGTYIMNSKDLCTIHILDKLKLAGIDSFKIEGRTKSIYYLSIITRAYRKAIDDFFSEKPFDKSLMDEVNAVANRDYITGFLERNPKQNGENYANSHLENQTHIFCGLVKETNDNKIRIAVRNRFEEGEILELVTPNETVVFEVKEILSVKGKKKQIAHGGGEDVWLSLNRSAHEFALIRKPLFQAVNKTI